MRLKAARNLLILVSTAAIAATASASPLLDSPPRDSIVHAKGGGTVGLDIRYRWSDDFFDDGGGRKPSEEGYHDAVFTLGAAYGLTRRLTLWLDIPFLFRKETDSLHREDGGLGDVSAGARYLFWLSSRRTFEWAADLSGTLPSGDTNLGTSELPLGWGTGGLAPGLVLRMHPSDRWSLDLVSSYMFRFARLVEYLQTPTGNLTVDWGDALRASTRLAFQALDWMTAAADVEYLHQLPTRAGTGMSASSDFLTVRPGLLFLLPAGFTLQTSVEVPVWGKSYPTLSFVESLAGLRYQMECRYAF